MKDEIVLTRDPGGGYPSASQARHRSYDIAPKVNQLEVVLSCFPKTNLMTK